MQQTSTPFVWCGPVFEPTGYADEARGMLRALDADGVRVALRATKDRPGFRDGLRADDRQRFERLTRCPIDPPLMVVQHILAEGFAPSIDAVYNIGRTMFETDGLPPHWVSACNAMDELWLPSSFNRDTFAAAGVRTPVTIVPGGIDAERFHPAAPPRAIPGVRGTVFLAVFEWRVRKGWDVLLRAWADAFAPDADVSLVLRTASPGGHASADRHVVINAHIDEFLRERCGRRRDEVAPIIVLSDTIDDDALPSLYTAAHAFVAPTRGEGWGRPFMEAMASGLPVLATRWSAHLDFMHDGNSLLIDIDGLVPAADPDMPMYRGQRWAEPRAAHLVELMQRVHTDRAGARALGAIARREMVEQWPWSRASAVIAARVREMGQTRTPVIAKPPTAATPTTMVVDAEAFGDAGHAPELQRWLSVMVARDAGVVIAPRGAVTVRPSRHAPAHAWWVRRRHESLVDAPTLSAPTLSAPTLSVLRRSDSMLPVRPATGAWVIYTGDVVHRAVPAHLRAVLQTADAILVPDAASAASCITSGVSPSSVHVVPMCRLDAALDVTPQRTAYDDDVSVVCTMVVTDDVDLVAADAIVRTWERAYASRRELVLRIVLAANPAIAVLEWQHQLVARMHASTPPVRIDVHAVPIADTMWPLALAATNAIILPGTHCFVPSLLPMAAAAGVPVVIGEQAASTDWIVRAGGWALPIASTGRFAWTALAAVIEQLCDADDRTLRADRARACYAALPDGETAADIVAAVFDAPASA